MLTVRTQTPERLTIGPTQTTERMALALIYSSLCFTSFNFANTILTLESPLTYLFLFVWLSWGILLLIGQNRWVFDLDHRQIILQPAFLQPKKQWTMHSVAHIQRAELKGGDVVTKLFFIDGSCTAIGYIDDSEFPRKLAKFMEIELTS